MRKKRKRTYSNFNNNDGITIFSVSSSFERWLVDEKGGADDDEMVKRFIYHQIKEWICIEWWRISLLLLLFVDGIDKDEDLKLFE